MLLVVPCILLAGLLFGAYALSHSHRTPSACALGDCPLSLHADDAGKTFVYGVATRFSVFLDGSRDPKERLHCAPEGVVGVISSAPQVVPPAYAATFEAIATGTCTLSSDHFFATIVIQGR